jgi:hypothetical protein
MVYTTSNTISVVKALRAGVVTTYAGQGLNFQLEIKNADGTSLVNSAATIVDATDLVAGSITMSTGAILVSGRNTITMKYFNNADADSATAVTKIAVCTVYVVTSATTVSC